MEAYIKALRGLADTLSWFVRAREARLLYVETTPSLRGPVIRLCRSGELHPDNPSPFVVLEGVFGEGTEAWGEGVFRLRAQHESRMLAMEKAGVSLPSLPAAPGVGDGLRAVALQLEQLLFARAPWHDGLVAIVAPGRLQAPAAFVRQLAWLMEKNELLPVRFVLIDAEGGALSGLLSRGAALRVVCAEDEGEAKAELLSLLGAMESAHPLLSGPGRVGAAWPAGVVPPSRSDFPHVNIEEVDAQLQQEGLVEPLAGAFGRKLSGAVLGAARAMRERRLDEALEIQARAIALCEEAGEARGRILMEMVLGAYCVGANDLQQAMNHYGLAEEQAHLGKYPGLEAQAVMARGAVLEMVRCMEAFGGQSNPGKGA